ncbi:vascular endothelial growth factor receptor 1-like isoform X2 [Centruroides vittatus]|uniref:vascular endothelial growth factor receptor 1-like isoform X2 n=1 Tax=Centruroides vittatus TaxID=120091 RepID=UPI00350F936D
MKRCLLFTFFSFIHIFDKCLTYLPPRLNVAKPYINVPPNTLLILECRGEYDTDWDIPKYLESDINKNNIKITYGRSSYSEATKLSIQHSPERTGLYICYYKSNNSIHGKNATAVYIFFNDHRLFKSQNPYKEEEIITVNSSVHSYIPCLPTSSEVRVILQEKVTEMSWFSVNESDIRQFNPMEGFLLDSPSRFFKPLRCRGNLDGKKDFTINFRIKGQENYIQKPFIEKHSKFWSAGSKMNLSCSAIINDENRTLCWIYPNSINLEENTTIKELENGLKLLESQLYFSQVDYRHEGHYICAYLFRNNCEEAVKDQTYITVYDLLMLEPVNFFTSEDPVKIEKNVGDTVEFIVNINYKVEEIEFHWEKKGIFILQNSRIHFNSNSQQIKMIIQNLSITDSGKYTIFVRRVESFKTFSFELSVQGKPIIDIINSKTDLNDLYMLNEIYNLTCRAEVLPEATVKWLWKECDTWEDCTNDDGKIIDITKEDSVSNKINITEIKYNDVGVTVVSLVLLVKASKSGKYFCKASNNLGYDSKSVLFIVTDVTNGIQVSSDNRELSKDKNIENIYVKCNFSTFLYSNVSWSHIEVPSYDFLPIGEDLYTERKDEIVSSYSNSSVIKLPVENVRSGLYVCSVKNKQFNNFTEKFTAVYLKAETNIPKKDSTASSSNSSTIIIIVVVIMFIAFFIICIILLLWMKRKRKLSRYNSFLFKKGQINLLSSELPLEDQVDLLPYDPRWEFPKDRLKLGRILGHGAFGRVVKAEAIGLRKDVPYTTVAVKMLKERDDETQHKALMAELKILIHLGKHVNILNLLGAVTKNFHRGELMVMVEYCCHGNLRTYLLRHREKFINQLDPITEKLNADICVQVSNSPKPNQSKSKEYTKPLALGVNNPTYNYSTGELIRCSGVNSQGEIGTDMTIVSSISGGENSSNTAISESGYSSTGGSSQMYIGREENRYSGIITTSDLLCYSFQCARGMSYLSSKKLIHRDLAARNILLAEGNIIKIADFGLAKDLYKYSKYVKKSDGPLPIKWMAIESIKDRIFTTKSDVWSFGVLLWEIFTLGGNPYPGFEMNEQFFKRLKEGYRMERPEYAPKNVYEIMMECWHEDPKERPEFDTLGEKLGLMLEETVKQHYLNLNNPYMEENKDVQTLESLIAASLQTDYMKMDKNSENLNKSEYLNFSGAFNENEHSVTKAQGNDYANASVIEKYSNTTNSKIDDVSIKKEMTENEEPTTYAKIITQNKSTDEPSNVEIIGRKEPEYLVLV